MLEPSVAVKWGLQWNNGLYWHQISSHCKYIRYVLYWYCKVTILTSHKMVICRTLVWLCMIFMVWSMVEPMRMGLLHLQQGVLGGQDIISVGYLEDNKALKAHGGASTWLNHRVSTGWTKWFYSPRKCSVWTGSAGFCLGRLGARGILLVCGCRRVFCQPWRWLSSSCR